MWDWTEERPQAQVSLPPSLSRTLTPWDPSLNAKRISTESTVRPCERKLGVVGVDKTNIMYYCYVRVERSEQDKPYFLPPLFHGGP